MRISSRQSQGVNFGPFLYLGAKHMVTGYDHLAFLAGVIFLLYRLRDVAIYASLFALGHSVTLLGAVLLGYRANPYIVDAIIGLSVVYKGFENTGGFRNLSWKLDPRAAVLGFGLVHGLGSRHQAAGAAAVARWARHQPRGVQCGRRVRTACCTVGHGAAVQPCGAARLSFKPAMVPANVLLMAVGFILFGYQLAGYLLAA